MKLAIKQLDKTNIQLYLDMLLERALWLERIGQPMWNIENLTPDRFESAYPNYTPYLIDLVGQVVGGFILLPRDGFLWSDEENSQRALYLHKLVIQPDYAGRGLAQDAIAQVIKLAKESGAAYLRLDCYGDRKYLVDLYEGCGFRKKRTSIMEDGTILYSFEMVL